MARTIFQTSWCQDSFYRALHLPVSARRGQPAGRHVEDAVAHFPVLQYYRVGGLFHHLHPARIFFREAMEASRILAGACAALPDPRGNNPRCAGCAFQKVPVRIMGAAIFQKTLINIDATK